MEDDVAAQYIWKGHVTMHRTTTSADVDEPRVSLRE